MQILNELKNIYPEMQYGNTAENFAEEIILNKAGTSLYIDRLEKSGDKTFMHRIKLSKARLTLVIDHCVFVNLNMIDLFDTIFLRTNYSVNDNLAWVDVDFAEFKNVDISFSNGSRIWIAEIQSKQPFEKGKLIKELDLTFAGIESTVNSPMIMMMFRDSFSVDLINISRKTLASGKFLGKFVTKTEELADLTYEHISTKPFLIPDNSIERFNFKLQNKGLLTAFFTNLGFLVHEFCSNYIVNADIVENKMDVINLLYRFITTPNYFELNLENKKLTLTVDDDSVDIQYTDNVKNIAIVKFLLQLNQG